MPVDLFIDVENRAIHAETIDAAIADVASLQIGEGSKVFRGDQSGIWLGASKWADAPFRVDMEGAMTATSITITGYVEDLGGQYDSAASGARVRILPDANTGIQVIDNSANNVFIALVGGTDVGDVIIGDYAGGSGVKWDKSTGAMLIRGDMDAGTITGVTFKTAASGVRVELTQSDAEIAMYDSGDDKVMSLDEDGTDIVLQSLDGRGILLDSATSHVGINEGLDVADWLSVGDWASLGGDLDMNKHDINEIGSLAYACAAYTGDAKLTEILKTINPHYPHIDTKYGTDWKKIDHDSIHDVVKATWTKKKLEKKKIVESQMTGFALEKVVLIQNQLILKMEERIKVLEGV